MPMPCDLFKKSLEQKFVEYHTANPQVYAGFVNYTEEVARTGRRRIGAKAVMERVRWDSWISAGPNDGFKINNSYTSRYVRLLEKERPDLAGLFETRKLKS